MTDSEARTGRELLEPIGGSLVVARQAGKLGWARTVESGEERAVVLERVERGDCDIGGYFERPCACRRRLPPSTPSPRLPSSMWSSGLDRAVSGKGTQASIRSPASRAKRRRE